MTILAPVRQEDVRQPAIRDIDYARPLSDAVVGRGGHRRRVGGLWERMGRRQLQFLKARGLRPEHRVLDVGCGALRATERFDADFGVSFDFAIAQSVFTHVSLNHVRLCLYRVAKVMKPGGRFFASFFEADPSHPIDAGQNDGRRWTERNIFFYYRADTWSGPPRARRGTCATWAGGGIRAASAWPASAAAPTAPRLRI